LESCLNIVTDAKKQQAKASFYFFGFILKKKRQSETRKKTTIGRQQTGLFVSVGKELELELEDSDSEEALTTRKTNEKNNFF
jgi:hypothetical protein